MAEQTGSPGEAIKTLRNMAGLTLKEVAAGADTATAYLSKVENGTNIPTPTYVARVAGYISQEIRERAA